MAMAIVLQTDARLKAEESDWAFMVRAVNIIDDLIQILQCFDAVGWLTERVSGL